MIDDKVLVGKFNFYKLFKHVDKDKDGFLSHQDVREFFNEKNILNSEQVDVLLKYVDD